MEIDKIGVVIPVREGSSRVKNKVTLPFYNDYNLLEWKIYQLQQVVKNNQIIISSDSENLKQISRNMGVEFIERDHFLCDGHKATFSEVITGVVRDIPFEHIAWTTVVVPLMNPSEYKEAFEIYMELVVNKKKHDSLVAVNLIKEYYWDAEKPLNYSADRNHTISQDLPDWYRITNGLYMMDKPNILNSGYFLGKKPVKHIVSKMSGVDIDEFEDYELALAFKKNYFKQNK